MMKTNYNLPKVRLNLNLSPQLMFYLSLLKLGLEEHLEGHYVLGLLLASKVHAPELALAQRPPDVKVFQRP